jgi:hypothetical protein
MLTGFVDWELHPMSEECKIEDSSWKDGKLSISGFIIHLTSVTWDSLEDVSLCTSGLCFVIPLSPLPSPLPSPLSLLPLSPLPSPLNTTTYSVPGTPCSKVTFQNLDSTRSNIYIKAVEVYFSASEFENVGGKVRAGSIALKDLQFKSRART